MLEVKATVYWKTNDEGGRGVPAFSGIRPSFNVDGELIMCEVISFDRNIVTMELGRTYEALIRLPYGEKYSEKIITGKLYSLQEASKVVGTATLEE